MLPVPLNSSKITSSMREPVSVSAVARIVSDPPSSSWRAVPNRRLGQSSAPAATPPVMTLHPAGARALQARARRVSESSRRTTSVPAATRRVAWFMTSSAVRRCSAGSLSKVEPITSTADPRTFWRMSVTSSGRSSRSRMKSRHSG